MICWLECVKWTKLENIHQTSIESVYYFARVWLSICCCSRALIQAHLDLLLIDYQTVRKYSKLFYKLNMTGERRERGERGERGGGGEIGERKGERGERRERGERGAQSGIISREWRFRIPLFFKSMA